MTNYADLRPHLQTGDIVLFSGKGGISEIIKRLSCSKWSHVGMVVRSDEWDMVLLWESVIVSVTPDVETGKTGQGVQLVPLSGTLGSYYGEASVRQIKTPLLPSQRKTLEAFRHEMTGRPYEQNHFELLRAVVDDFGTQNTRNLSSLFCSELVAEAFQRMGLLPESPASNEYTPADFSDGARVPIVTHGPELPVARG